MQVVLKSLADVPESFRAEYEEKDGEFYLKLEGGDPTGYTKESEHEAVNAKLVEFRDSNRTLNSQVEQFRTKYNGIDPDEHKKQKEKIEELEKRGVKDGDDISTIVQKAISVYHEKTVTPLNKQLEEIGKREEEANEALARKDLESLLTKAGLNAGVNEKAMMDYLSRGLHIFTLVDGKPVARKDGTPLYSNLKKTEPLSIGEWAAELANDAPHLFKQSKGGGTGPVLPGGGGDKTTYDPTDDDEFIRNVDKIAKREIIAREVP